MADVAALLAQKADLEAQLVAAEQDALAELLAAKEAYRANPTNETAQRRLDAIAAIQAIRALVRAGRPLAVGGDAFVATIPGELVTGASSVEG